MKNHKTSQFNAWSDPEYWNNIYKEELSGKWGDQSQFRHSQYIEKFVNRYGLNTPLKILYAGCGISLLGEFMAHMGHHVTAIDISTLAIQFSKNRADTSNVLWRCADWRLVIPYMPEYLRRKEYHVREAYVKREFLALYKAGGFCTYQVSNWNDPELPADNFDLILNQNGLRRACTEETRSAANSFYRLLKPGGLLIESTVNALEREDEIVSELIEAGFIIEQEFLTSGEENQVHYLDAVNKYAVYCSMTG